MTAQEVNMFHFDDTPHPTNLTNISKSNNFTLTIDSSMYASDAIDEDSSGKTATLSHDELVARRQANVQEKVKEALEFKLEVIAYHYT